ncbi:MAG: RluA family pseudouridine synthase [Clostridia bacterium]|nr:RluA family pseudouridine synthase [Clostridia bacterium]
MKIIYEDNHLLVAEKPPNMPVQEDASHDMDLLRTLKTYVKEKYDKPGEAYLGLVHRLDRPVGGVMVFARTSKAAERLSAQFASKRAKKRYVALVCAKAEPEGVLTDYLVRDEATNNTRVASESAAGAKNAKLSYRRIAARDGLSLLDVELSTGRHHQIRVQLASRGMPIWGDQRYNPEARPGQQIALWAYGLTVEHPTQKLPMRFISMPHGGVWDGFETELQAALAEVSVAYIDDDLLVADKPAGLEVVGDDGVEDTLAARIATVYGDVYPVHRIDATTRGLVLFARSARVRDELAGLLRRGKIRKYYLCTVAGAPPKPADTLRAYCIKDAERGYVSVYDSMRPGAKEMLTRYRVLGGDGATTRLEVELLTGRTHQIRAHLAHIGCPLLGDDKYGDRALNRELGVREVQLIAQRLQIERESGAITVER